MRITLHIGTHKTGTTFLQRQFEAQRAKLARQGVHYLDNGPNHSWLYLAFCEQPEAEHAAMRLGIVGKSAACAWVRERRSALKRELGELTAQRVLISGEELCRLSAPAAAQLIDFLSDYSEAIDVVCCVRDPVGYAISDAQESIKGGLTWDEAIRQPGSTHFRSALETYSDLLGRAAIAVFSYQRGAPPLHLENFSAATGIALEFQDGSADTNPAMTAEAAYLLGEVNRLYPQFIDDRTNPLRANIPPAWLSDLGGMQFTLPPEVLSGIQNELDADYSWLRAFAGIEVAGAQSAPRVDWQPLPDQVKAILSDCAGIVHKAAKTIEDTLAEYLLKAAELEYLKGRTQRGDATVARLREFRANDAGCHKRIDAMLAGSRAA